ncbi:hypothetical protein LCGC14_0400160 [marine sediment metagenome]|uniref:DNA (cytosine-5-)-methyltransferase n=1 Tax=marine sediment metagenome TaxID=412755 RepID=A0A0F9VIV3_9ZZZZ
MTLPIEKRIILDLYAGTCAWSKPYKDAGYDVKPITLPENDIRDDGVLAYCISLRAYGILAACDCSKLSNAGRCRDKDRTFRDAIDAVEMVTKALYIIAMTNPIWWVIENPVGLMKQLIGKPQYRFQPCEFGHNYTKHTCLWGRFTPLFVTQNVKPQPASENLIMKLGGKSERTKRLRSITPSGFAQAFFKANQ